MSANIIAFPSRVPDQGARIRAAWPSEWGQGAVSGFERGSFPRGFTSWPLARKNGWWSGYNRGRCDRLRYEET